MFWNAKQKKEIITLRHTECSQVWLSQFTSYLMTQFPKLTRRNFERAYQSELNFSNLFKLFITLKLKWIKLLYFKAFIHRFWKLDSGLRLYTRARLNWLKLSKGINYLWCKFEYFFKSKNSILIIFFIVWNLQKFTNYFLLSN